MTDEQKREMGLYMKALHDSLGYDVWKRPKREQVEWVADQAESLAKKWLREPER